jgi:hypothetical protein
VIIREGRGRERASVERAGAGIAFEELGEADVLSPLPSYNFIFCSSFPPHSPASNVLHFSFGLDSWARRVGCRDRLEQSRQGRRAGRQAQWGTACMHGVGLGFSQCCAEPWITALACLFVCTQAFFTRFFNAVVFFVAPGSYFLFCLKCSYVQGW